VQKIIFEFKVVHIQFLPTSLPLGICCLGPVHH